MSDIRKEGLQASLETFNWLNASDLPLRYFGDPILHEVCEPVQSYEFGTKHILGISSELIDTLKRYRAHTGLGRGLAANQVGYNKRMAAVWWDVEPLVLYNPEIISSSGLGVYTESCISSGGLILGEVRRPWKAKFTHQDANGTEYTTEASELQTRVLLHEIDHLEGITCDQRYEPGSLRFVTGGKEEILGTGLQKLED